MRNRATAIRIVVIVWIVAAVARRRRPGARPDPARAGLRPRVEREPRDPAARRDRLARLLGGPCGAVLHPRGQPARAAHRRGERRRAARQHPGPDDLDRYHARRRARALRSTAPWRSRSISRGPASRPTSAPLPMPTSTEPTARGAGHRAAVVVHVSISDLRRHRDRAAGAARQPEDPIPRHVARCHPLLLVLCARRQGRCGAAQRQRCHRDARRRSAPIASSAPSSAGSGTAT